MNRHKSSTKRKIWTNFSQDPFESAKKRRNRLSSASKDPRMTSTGSTALRATAVTTPKKNTARESKVSDYAKDTYVEDMMRRMENKLGKASMIHKNSLVDRSNPDTLYGSPRVRRKSGVNYLDSSHEIEMDIDVNEFTLESCEYNYDESIASLGLDPVTMLGAKSSYAEVSITTLQNSRINQSKIIASKNLFNGDFLCKRPTKIVRFASNEYSTDSEKHQRKKTQLVMNRDGYMREEYDAEFDACCNFT
ncbi:unnamed protein product [Moneuplotes crassus]|uniref:Uncharacterized protein n=1 Tax=Euplotes crassus TaxID=5936 RepID=A0AAD1UDB7_EUPCR|nr:unnamed protein product [Moneuplotes crassus]